MSILRTRFYFALAATLILTAHRLPAPIQEVPMSPSPSPPPPASVQQSPLAQASQSPPPMQTNRASFAGTWTGEIGMQRAGEVEVTLVIDRDGPSIHQNSKLGMGNRPLTYDGNALSWNGGIKGEVAWTMKLNPDGGSAIVTRAFAGKTTTAIFKRGPATKSDDPAPVGTKRNGRLRQKSN